MRITELRTRISAAFPDPTTYSQDIVHSELGGITVNQALEVGMEAGDIWRGILAHNPEMAPKFR